MAVIEPRNHDGAANRATELVPIERRRGILEQRAVGLHGLPDEEIARVEGVVAEELGAGPAQLVRARFRGHGDDAAATPALRGEHAGQDLELAHLLDRRHDDEGIERELVVVDAVDPSRRSGRLGPVRVRIGGGQYHWNRFHTTPNDNRQSPEVATATSFERTLKACGGGHRGADVRLWVARRAPRREKRLWG